MQKNTILLAFMLVFCTAFSQKVIDVPGEKGNISLESADVFPYEDGSFSVCKYSGMAYGPNREYFMYSYDKEGNLTGSYKNKLDYEKSPYLHVASSSVHLDKVNKKFIQFSVVDKKFVEIAEWDDKLQKTNSVKIEVKEESNSYCSSTKLDNGKIVFYVFQWGKGCNRYEYDPKSKTAELKSIFAEYMTGKSIKQFKEVVFAGIMNGQEYFYTIADNGSAGKGETKYRAALLTYTPEDGLEEVSSKEFTFRNTATVGYGYRMYNLDKQKAVESKELYLCMTIECLKNDCYPDKDHPGGGGFQLIKISDDHTFNEMTFWPNAGMSWNRPPSVGYRIVEDNFYVLFGANEYYKGKLDIESQELSEMEEVKPGGKYSMYSDMDIFFFEGEKMDDLVKNADKFERFYYDRDSKGNEKLFLISYRNFVKDLKVTVYN